jgi:hypothetical protein
MAGTKLVREERVPTVAIAEVAQGDSALVTTAEPTYDRSRNIPRAEADIARTAPSRPRCLITWQFLASVMRRTPCFPGQKKSLAELETVISSFVAPCPAANIVFDAARSSIAVPTDLKRVISSSFTRPRTRPLTKSASWPSMGSRSMMPRRMGSRMSPASLSAPSNVRDRNTRSSSLSRFVGEKLPTRSTNVPGCSHLPRTSGVVLPVEQDTIEAVSHADSIDSVTTTSMC